MNDIPRPTLLVGSVPLASAEDVFSMAGEVLGNRLRSIPDGETGKRIHWCGWQKKVMDDAPFLSKARPEGADGVAEGAGLGRYEVRGELADARFGKLGYSDAAIESYKTFAHLRDSGKIPKGVRFQVSLPTPLAPLTVMIQPKDYEKVEPLYESAMREEVEAICEAIPSDDLAIQWDIANEIGILEGIPILPNQETIFSNARNEVLSRILNVVSWVPDGVALGLHFCYGDYEHKHYIEPKDTRLMVDLANAIFRDASRKIDWLHMPVPKERDDDAYFAPLADLDLSKGTQLYLGLVHHTDGLEGGERRIAVAQRHVPSFGIATECGLGRRPSQTIPDVMKLTAALASV